MKSPDWSKLPTLPPGSTWLSVAFTFSGGARWVVSMPHGPNVKGSTPEEVANEAWMRSDYTVMRQLKEEERERLLEQQKVKIVSEPACSECDGTGLKRSLTGYIHEDCPECTRSESHYDRNKHAATHESSYHRIGWKTYWYVGAYYDGTCMRCGWRTQNINRIDFVEKIEEHNRVCEKHDPPLTEPENGWKWHRFKNAAGTESVVLYKPWHGIHRGHGEVQYVQNYDFAFGPFRGWPSYAGQQPFDFEPNTRWVYDRKSDGMRCIRCLNFRSRKDVVVSSQNAERHACCACLDIDPFTLYLDLLELLPVKS